jgi:hypothetical protein
MIATALELRAAFDRAFAEPPPPAVEHADVLAIRAGGAAHALPQRQLAALRTDLQIVGLPSRARAFLGVAVVHGTILPVWDLGLLVGAGPVRAPRWCAIVRGESAALAFDHLDGYLRVAVPIGVAIAHGDRSYGVVDLAGLLAAQNGMEHGR